MYILKNINDAVYYPLTVSDLAYFFMGKTRKAKYITEEEYIKLKLEKEVEEKRAQIRAFRERSKQAEEERKKRLEIDAEATAWEEQRNTTYNAWKREQLENPQIPSYNNSFFDKKADQARETLEKHPFDPQHPTKRDDHHHHRDHHNDHKASWGHDADWNHGDSHKSDSTHSTHTNDNHDSHSYGGGDSGGDSAGDGGGD